MANDRAFLYCPECNAHTLLFKTMADGWYPRGPEFLPAIEEWLDEHKTCQWPWAPGSSAPPLHIRYECAEPKLPANSIRHGEPGPSIDDIVAGKVPGIRIACETHPGVEPREILATSGRGEAVTTPTQLDIRITLDPGPEGQAIAREIRAVLDRAANAARAARFSGEPGAFIEVAPAWTREAPKEEGWYFARCSEWPAAFERGRALHYGRHGDTRASWDLDSCEEPPKAPIEHWPVPIPEPPK